MEPPWFHLGTTGETQMWTLEDLTAVDAVIRAGNFSAAARRLGVTRSAVSKAVRRVEDVLAVELFVRTTHDVQPTDVGLAFHTRAIHALVAAQEATALVRERLDQPVGTVRLSLPTSLGVAYLAEGLPALLAEHSGLAVEVSLSDRMVDVVAEGFDAVVRIAATRDLQDSELIARTLTTGRLRLCASPEWVTHHGRPRQVSDLSALPCVVFTQSVDGDGHATWPIMDDDEQRAGVRVSGPLRADSGLALAAAVASGVGIGLLAGFLVSAQIADGRLVELLPDATTRSYTIYALRPRTAYRSLAAETVMESLRAWSAEMEA